MKTESIRIEEKILNRLRIYCKDNGLVLTWFASRAIEEKIERDKK